MAQLVGSIGYQSSLTIKTHAL